MSKLSKNLASAKRAKADEKLERRHINESAVAQHLEQVGRTYARRKAMRDIYGANLYEPHQGKKEMARRAARGT